jgi:hypothetical protein
MGMHDCKNITKKHLYISILIFAGLFCLTNVYSQAPQKMSFQSIIRNSDGKLLDNRTVQIRMSILEGSASGDDIFIEVHRTETNSNGLASLILGQGLVQKGNIGEIDWSSGLYFLKTETDINGGTNYQLTGVNQFLSVPYALYAETSGSSEEQIYISGEGAITVTGSYPNFIISSSDINTTYTAGNGIAIDGTKIINTAPDQTVTLQGEGATTISGTYPDFIIRSTVEAGAYVAGNGISIEGTTITNTAPDLKVTLQGEGATTILGTYPDFIIRSTDESGTYDAGNGISIEGTTISNTAPDKVVKIIGSGSTTVTGSYPEFTISSTDEKNEYTAGEGISIDGTIIINTAPDREISLTSDRLTITGTYPDFHITVPDTDKHYVGEYFGGGIVFYTYDEGKHGLIASLQDISNTTPWSIGFTLTNAFSHYDGPDNTTKINNAQGAGNYAARLCANYNAGGYSDWYLPSLWELELLHKSAFLVSHKLANDGNTATTPLQALSSYWSSTQFDNQLAYMLYFAEGVVYLDFKTVSYRVRAVRRF